MPTEPAAQVSTLVVEGARSSLDIEVQGGPLRGGGRLVRDYLAGAAPLGRFFAGHPADVEAYRTRAAEVEGRLDAAARARLAPALEPLGDADGRLRSILDGNGYFVTTGQQPALFGGPLYTLYKALAAVRLAAALEPHLGRPVLALFWIGADDHDWAEASHAAILDAQGYVQRIDVAAPDDALLLPMSERTWGPGIEAALDAFSAALPSAGYGQQVARHLRAAYTPTATVGASFAATCRFLLQDQRIVLVNSADPVLRRAAGPVLRVEAERTAEHNALLMRQTQRLLEAGYPAQVAITPDASNLMLLDEHGRDRLIRGQRGWYTRRERTAIGEADLLRRIAAEPERFSPNVLLRPVVESAVFPTIAYVAGPGELRYFAQLGCLFLGHGIRPPVIVPRPSATLIEPQVRRLLDRLQLDAATFSRPLEQLVTAAVREQLPAPVAAALQRLRDDVAAAFAALAAAAGVIDPTLDGPLGSARNRSLREAARAERRILRQLRRRHDVLVEQLRRVAASLNPGDAPQERVLNVMPFLARYGPALIPAIAAALDLEPDGTVVWDEQSCAG